MTFSILRVAKAGFWDSPQLIKSVKVKAPCGSIRHERTEATRASARAKGDGGTSWKNSTYRSTPSRSQGF